MSFDLGNYRSCQEQKEILRILQKSSALRENFVWQITSQGRQIEQVDYFEIDFVARELVVFLKNAATNLTEGLSLYVKLDYRRSVFKVSDFKLGSGNAVHFSFPKEIKTPELRASTRYRLSTGQDKYITLKIDGKNPRENQFRVFDISKEGVGLLVSEQELTELKDASHLSLQGESLGQNIVAQLVYGGPKNNARFSATKQKEIKVGLKLLTQLPAEYLSRFIQ